MNKGAGSKLLAGFLRPDALSGRGWRWAKEEGTVTQFANTTRAGCMTCVHHANSPLNHDLVRSQHITELQRSCTADSRCGRISATQPRHCNVLCDSATALKGTHLRIIEVGLAMRRFEDGGNAVRLPSRLGIRGSQERATTLRHQRGNLQDLQRVPSNLIAVPACPPPRCEASPHSANI